MTSIWLQFLMTVFLLFVSFSAGAQTVLIKGTLKNEVGKSVVADANIIVVETGEGTSSDKNGHFSLKIAKINPAFHVVVTHINFITGKYQLTEFSKMPVIYLKPKIVSLEETTVFGKRDALSKTKDLPFSGVLLNAKDFENGGYSGAADLLKMDNSIQADEDLNGKKTISMRGGNPDEILVLYDGIRLNRNFDNSYNLSQIDLQDLEKIEIIKGSNSVLYGAEAFSGVINLISKEKRDYTARFRQEFGPYNSGKWGVQVNHISGPWSVSGSYRAGAIKREFNAEIKPNPLLINEETSQMVTLGYELDTAKAGNSSAVRLQWMGSALQFENQRDDEKVKSSENLISASYKGPIWGFEDFNLRQSFHRQFDSQSLIISDKSASRVMDDKTIAFSLSKNSEFPMLDWTVATQADFTSLKINDQSRELSGIYSQKQNTVLIRNHVGIASILTHFPEIGSGKINRAEISISTRYDRVTDKIKPEISDQKLAAYFKDTTEVWESAVFKFSTSLYGSSKNLYYSMFLNMGKNVKFPSLNYQMSLPGQIISSTNKGRLKPEKNESIEIGLNIGRDFTDNSLLNGWEFTSCLFRNYYENKFRTILEPGTLVAFYDNVQKASIAGIEANYILYFYTRKISADVGGSYYSIDEKLAFPFKSTFKRNLSLKYDDNGYHLQIFWFYESEQAGWIRGEKNTLAEVELPSFSNLDIHARKNIEINNYKAFINLSFRNILKTGILYNGLALRDQRIYLTFGVQY